MLQLSGQFARHRYAGHRRQQPPPHRAMPSVRTASCAISSRSFGSDRYTCAAAISTASVPAAFAHLAGVAEQLDVGGQPRDGLGSVIRVRNDVIHPTRTKRTKWSIYQWAEAHSLAVHFLEMALLAYIGYRGRTHPRISANRWLGYTEDVPWLGC